jgi:putative phage-type endonuclease
MFGVKLGGFDVQNILVNTSNLSRDEWLRYRNQGIGGSDVATICGLNKYKSKVELWMEKTGQIVSKEAGEAAYWGNVMEPIVRTEFTLRTNLNVRLVHSILKHPIHTFMLANLDGVIDDTLGGECIFEAKTASIYKLNEWEDSIPEGYMLQIQHYMAVTGYKKTFIAVLIGGNQFKYKTIERDDELIEMIIKLESDFWNYVTSNIPPPMDGSEASSELLNRLYPETKNKLKIALPLEANDLINQYELAKEKEKEASEMKDEAANKLKDLLGDNESGTVNGKIVTWKSISSERFDTKRFQIENLDTYKSYLAKLNFRRFSIK